MTVLKVRTLADFIEVFPSMNLNETIDFYENVVKTKSSMVTRLENECNEKSVCILMNQLSELMNIEHFLSGFFARCFCKERGKDLF